MKMGSMRLFHKNQRGVTLIELAIAIGITGSIMAGVSNGIFQIITINADSNAHMMAIKQVENALHWIGRDAQMAQIVETTDDPDPDVDKFPLTLRWTDWDNVDNVVEYDIDDEGNLIRRHTQWVDTTESTVARLIDSDVDSTNCTWDSDARKLTLQITATIPWSGQEASETRTSEISPRPAI